MAEIDVDDPDRHYDACFEHQDIADLMKEDQMLDTALSDEENEEKLEEHEALLKREKLIYGSSKQHKADIQTNTRLLTLATCDLVFGNTRRISLREM